MVQAGLHRLLAVVCIGVALVACQPSREATKSPRSATEQLLISQAIERSLDEMSVPMLIGAPIFMEVSGLTGDQFYVRDTVAAYLASKHGVKIRDRREDAKYRVMVMVQSLGTELDQSFFGMPQFQGGLLPIAIPELPIYKFIREIGYVRYSLNIYEMATGRLMVSTPWYTKTAASRQYTILFFITFRTSTLTDPPEISKAPIVPILTPVPKDPSDQD